MSFLYLLASQVNFVLGLNTLQADFKLRQNNHERIVPGPRQPGFREGQWRLPSGERQPAGRAWASAGGAAGRRAVGLGAMAAVAGVRRPRAGLGTGTPKGPAEPADK